jgi:hypothetical protein
VQVPKIRGGLARSPPTAAFTRSRRASLGGGRGRASTRPRAPPGEAEAGPPCVPVRRQEEAKGGRPRAAVLPRAVSMRSATRRRAPSCAVLLLAVGRAPARADGMGGGWSTGGRSGEGRGRARLSRVGVEGGEFSPIVVG